MDWMTPEGRGGFVPEEGAQKVGDWPTGTGAWRQLDVTPEAECCRMLDCSIAICARDLEVAERLRI